MAALKLKAPMTGKRTPMSSGASSGTTEAVQQPSDGSTAASSASFLLPTSRLRGKNYLEWAQTFKLAVEGKGELGYLTGDTKKPAANDPRLPIWKSENSMVMAWLISSMEPSIARPHMLLPTAKDIWLAVREMYSNVENSSQIYELKTRLWAMKQGAKEVTTYYSKVVANWICVTSTNGCSDDSTKFLKREENERVCHIFRKSF